MAEIENAPAPQPHDPPVGPERKSPDAWAEELGHDPHLLAGAKHLHRWVDGDLLTRDEYEQGYAALVSLPWGGPDAGSPALSEMAHQRVQRELRAVERERKARQQARGDRPLSPEEKLQEQALHAAAQRRIHHAGHPVSVAHTLKGGR